MDSREEAVVAWRESKGPAASLRRWSGGGLGALSLGRGWLAGIAAVATLAAVAVVVALTRSNDPLPAGDSRSAMDATASRTTAASVSDCAPFASSGGMPAGLGYNTTTNTHCIWWTAEIGREIFVRLRPTGENPQFTELMFGSGPSWMFIPPDDFDDILQQQFLDLPPGYLPSRAAGPDACFSRDVSFRLSVGESWERMIGGEVWLSACGRFPWTASGCHSDGSTNLRLIAPTATPGFEYCVTWVDSYAGERGFVVSLENHKTGDVNRQS